MLSVVYRCNDPIFTGPRCDTQELEFILGEFCCCPGTLHVDWWGRQLVPLPIPFPSQRCWCLVLVLSSDRSPLAISHYQKTFELWIYHYYRESLLSMIVVLTGVTRNVTRKPHTISPISSAFQTCPRLLPDSFVFQQNGMPLRMTYIELYGFRGKGPVMSTFAGAQPVGLPCVGSDIGGLQ